jgi:hypothetical protein
MPYTTKLRIAAIPAVLSLCLWIFAHLSTDLSTSSSPDTVMGNSQNRILSHEKTSEIMFPIAGIICSILIFGVLTVQESLHDHARSH